MAPTGSVRGVDLELMSRLRNTGSAILYELPNSSLDEHYEHFRR